MRAVAKPAAPSRAERVDAADPAPGRQHAAPAAPLQAAGNLALQRLFAGGALRAKQKVGAPADPAEVEADRIADAVMSGKPAGCTCGAGEPPCSSCQAASASTLRRKPRAHDLPAVSPRLSLGPERRLGESERAFFEPRYQADLSEVRIHDNADAAASAAHLNARAFSLGSRVAFGAGEYQPQTGDGRRLLAHELAHVLQQAQSPPGVAPVIRRQGLPPGSGSPPASGSPPTPQPAPHPLSTPAGPIACYAPQGPTLQFEGQTLAGNIEYLDPFLRDYIARHGEDGAKAFLRRARAHVASQADDLDVDDMAARVDILASYGSTEDPALVQQAKLVVTAEKTLADILASDRQWLDDFQAKAKAVAETALEESQKHVLAEAVRYGVGNLHLEFSFWWGTPEIKGDVADNASTRGIAIAAQGLLARKKKVEQAQAEYNEFARAMGSPSKEVAKQRSGLQDYEIEIHLQELHGPITQAQADLDVFRIQVQSRFPLLAALASDEDFKRGDLEDLAKGAKGKDSDAAAVIVEQIVDKLTNIAKVKEELKPGGDINIWRVPSIIEATKLETGALPGTLYGRLVDDKVKDEKPSALTGILIGILQFGLVLLAPFTEGLSLIPAAAIGAGTAYQHFKEYQTQKALHGTDFGAAALSAEDPSLFWLAVDIVGAGFDVGAAGGAALRLFRQLAPAAKAVRGAQAGEDAIRALERNAAELGGQTLARRVADDARAVQQGFRKEIGITAEEARQFEQAASDVATRELREGAQSAESIAGRKVTVSRSGALFSCSSPCTMMRERYKDLIVRKPEYAQRLNELEGRAASLSTGAEADLARKQIANEAAALEREMRTTALPGDWTSPLKDSAEFEALVKRRGSVAAELDHHPPGWTGKDEARFRYGANIEPEPGYRFTMDENGSLRYDRLDASLPPHRYNPATGVFEDAAEEGLIRATKGAEETRELAKLPAKEREAMEAAFEKRRDLIAERDRLEALEEAGKIDAKDAEKLKKLYAEVNEQSRQLGEQAAEGVMRGKGGKKLYPLGKTYSTSGDFDQVWKVGDEFHVVEAKGGSSGLGSRAVGEGVRAEQGTVEYARSIAQNMATNGATKEIRQLGNQLLAALAEGKVKYVLVRAPIGTEAGAAVLRDVKVSEFVLE